MFQLASRVASLAMGVVGAALLARSLGAEQFGTLSLFLTIAAIATNIGDFGVSQIAVREIASRPHDRGALVGALFLLRLSAGLVLGAVSAAFVIVLLDGTAHWAAIPIFATLPLAAFSSFNAAAQARLRPEIAGIIIFAQSIAWLGAIAVLASRHAGLTAYGVAFFGVAASQAALGAAIAGRLSGITFSSAWPRAKELLSKSWTLGVAGIFVTAYYRIDSVLLYQMKGSVENGHYSAAYRFLDAAQIIPATLLGVLLPVLSKLINKEVCDPRFERVFHLALTITALVGVPIAFVGSILSPSIVSLVYGNEYKQAGTLLAILFPTFIFISSGYVLTAVMIALEQTRQMACIAVILALLNIVSNLIMIPKHGAIAAAWITLATDAGVCLSFAFIVSHQLTTTFPWPRWARVFAAATPAILVAELLRSAPISISAPSAAIVYAIMIIGLRPISGSDIRSMLHRTHAIGA